MRRNERARFFLDLLESGLNDGRSAEATIVDASASRDRSLGVRFHLLAAYIEKGIRLSAALESVPRLLPPEIKAMLKTGERIGDIRKVFPACRALLKDAVSNVRGALNYVVILAFVATPAAIMIPLIIRIKVLPSYVQVFSGTLEGMSLPAFTRLVFGTNGIVFWIQIAILFLVWIALVAYVSGPRLQGWLDRTAPGLANFVQFCLPWRRKRLQRDFSAMLALLLDSGVSEGEAVTLAAASTANSALERRADKARAQLEGGVPLPHAIRSVDDAEEFGWRLSNALKRGSGFLRALAGWHDALDAKAFQMEQSAAQLATTGLVLFNGLVIGSFVLAVFLALVQLLNQAVLW